MNRLTIMNNMNVCKKIATTIKTKNIQPWVINDLSIEIYLAPKRCKQHLLMTQPVHIFIDIRLILDTRFL